jgi:hypothetical protein
MKLGDGTIARMIGRGFPVAGGILEILGPEIIETIQKQPIGRPVEEVITAIAPAVERIAERHPEIKNNLNLESPVQSGTTWGMGIALLTAGGAIAGMFQTGNVDAAVLGPLIATVLASLFGLWRRWGGNLKPLFSRGK